MVAMLLKNIFDINEPDLYWRTMHRSTTAQTQMRRQTKEHAGEGAGAGANENEH